MKRGLVRGEVDNGVLILQKVWCVKNDFFLSAIAVQSSKKFYGSQVTINEIERYEK
jgi:hypothetical protein